MGYTLPVLLVPVVLLGTVPTQGYRFLRTRSFTREIAVSIDAL